MTFTVHKDVKVAMRDGTELATDLWVHGPEHPSCLILPVIRR